MTVINLVPGVSINGTMADGRAEGRHRQTLLDHEKTKAEDEADVATVVGAVKGLMDYKGGAEGRKSVRQFYGRFVQKVYPKSYLLCETVLSNWMKE